MSFYVRSTALVDRNPEKVSSIREHIRTYCMYRLPSVTRASSIAQLISTKCMISRLFKNTLYTTMKGSSDRKRIYTFDYTVERCFFVSKSYVKSVVELLTTSVLEMRSGTISQIATILQFATEPPLLCRRRFYEWQVRFA